ncbi:hypothetical protein M501DRAFT_985330 [Patellaria atrata CBS 101060]|uniref:Uncharacterized protein n=1 Tax=Patellaria atrata CBS 101060 TaxID=1346257 RepID=A0A9P4SJY6_9PEZI|nr:hypothetical protein M501DRAFT_985330 [Patellaria atrata CBS 101060]
MVMREWVYEPESWIMVTRHAVQGVSTCWDSVPNTYDAGVKHFGIIYRSRDPGNKRKAVASQALQCANARLSKCRDVYRGQLPTFSMPDAGRYTEYVKVVIQRAQFNVGFSLEAWVFVERNGEVEIKIFYAPDTCDAEAEGLEQFIIYFPNSSHTGAEISGNNSIVGNHSPLEGLEKAAK